jgi:hypothetical protein
MIRCKREYSTNDWPVTIHTHPATIMVTYAHAASVRRRALMRKPMACGAMPQEARRKDQKYNP